MPIASLTRPPQILQIVREPLKPGQEDAYRAIEEDTARISAAEECPHPYLGAESLTGAKEIWWFNGYQSQAEQKHVADAYANNTRLLASLQRQSERKSVLTMTPTEVLATYRPDMSGGTLWTVGHGRFLVITVTARPGTFDGTVFETSDHTYLIVRSTQTREAADLLAGPGATVLEVRPTFSFPAPEWIASDTSFWRRTSATNQ